MKLKVGLYKVGKKVGKEFQYQVLGSVIGNGDKVYSFSSSLSGRRLTNHLTPIEALQYLANNNMEYVGCKNS